MEFGNKAQLVDNAEGIVLDHSVHRGNPPDEPLLAPAIARIKGPLGRAPRAVTADRGYGEAAVQDTLTELGDSTVVIPRKGKPAQARRDLDHGRGFRRLVKWRTGSEGRISYLKHRYGWDRTRLDGFDGSGTWCGLGAGPQHRQDRRPAVGRSRRAHRHDDDGHPAAHRGDRSCLPLTRGHPTSDRTRAGPRRPAPETR